ncbi:LuxR C-terminal-related transcriptional regulator [Streptomyces sp. NPDC008313]|uniref:LuxR C-terminal-related transcriptional regulator n=1 Tax=Streptomyces sp. NPDC008313 TaxID=3364826 RepID=UPI0036F120A9
MDAQTAAFLREAHHKIMNQFAHDHYELYDYVRAVAAKLAAFDSFYIGLLHGANRVRFPYGYEGGAYDDPVSHTYGPHGQTAWLLKHQQTYRYAYDDGAVLHAGISFGDTQRRSADAVTVPMFRYEGERRGRLFGMMSMHSYRPGAFDDNTVRAFEWLAGVLARVLNRAEEDSRALLLLPPGDDAASAALTSDHVVEYLANRLAEIRGIAQGIAGERDGGRTGITGAEADAEHTRTGAGAEDARTGGRAQDAEDAEDARRIVRICERTQSELIDMSLRVDEGPERRFLSLTQAEQGVAVLLVSGLANQEIATQLGISPNTVKTHLKNVCRKYGMSNRVQVAEDVRKHLLR